MNPKVSIIVTTYNRENLLEKTLESILAQSYHDFELIVVDNYSQYDFFSFINKFSDKRIKAYRNENGGIIAINRNFGINLAAGEFIAMCDDDDIWEPDKLKKQVDLFLSKPSIVMCCTNVSIIGVSNRKNILKRLITYFKNCILSFNIIPARYLLVFLPFITNSSALFKKKILDKTGILDESSSLCAYEDFEFWFRMSNFGDIYFINEKLVQYRVHQQQFSDRLVKENRIKTRQIIFTFWPQLNFLQKGLYFLTNILF
jgi:teichuronic acid biosynthesis glycosyltransferase TuaG